MTPSTLDEALVALDEILKKEDPGLRVALAKTSEPDEMAIDLHHSVGQYLRNTWGLWRDSNLSKCMRDQYGIAHPDDMSHRIIVEYCRRGPHRAEYPTRFERWSFDGSEK